MNNVAGVVAGVIAAACFATHATAQSSVPSAPVERAYTTLDLDKCKHTKGREVEDYGSWRCTGYSGILVRVSAGFGMALLGMYYFAHMDFPYIENVNNLVVDYHIVYIGCLAYVVARQAGHVLGLDGVVEKLSMVEAHPRLAALVH